MSTLQLTSTGARYIYLPVRAVDPVTGGDVDLSAATTKMTLVRPNDRPDAADWVAANNVGTRLVVGKTYNIIRALVGVGGAIAPDPGEYAAWVQVTLGVEIVEERCGSVLVS